MQPEVVNSFYLVVGGERRKDPQQGDQTKKYKRRVKGRKGVGKLTPFGICETLEIISSGGDKINQNGNTAGGYKTAHFIMRRSEILTDEDGSYEPEVGHLDRTIQLKPGTAIITQE